MTSHLRQPAVLPPLHNTTPEHLLLLTMFGSSATQHRVEAELDRRAALRPRHLRAMPRSAPRLRAA
jgi:hypothetical protein